MGVSYSVQLIPCWSTKAVKSISNTHKPPCTHSMVCDWCAAQRPECSTDGPKQKSKKTKKTNHTPISLNYFLLIWFPACSPTDTRHPAVLQRKKPNREKEGLKLVSLNSPPQLPPMERLKQTQVSLQVLLKSLCSPITHHTHHKDILHLSFVEFVFSPFNLQAV